MELDEAIRRRAMVRSFSSDRVEPAVVDHILSGALRSPTAGNSQGTCWVVLEGPEQTAVYFETTTDEEWRRRSLRSEGLRRAPVILLAYSSPHLYLDRYSEEDKSRSGLGEGVDRWPVPYWTGDAAFGVMTTLLERGGCRPRGVHPRDLPRRGRAGLEARRTRRMAPVLCSGSGPSRRQRPPLPVARPAPTTGGAADPPGPLVMTHVGSPLVPELPGSGITPGWSRPVSNPHMKPATHTARATISRPVGDAGRRGAAKGRLP